MKTLTRIILIVLVIITAILYSMANPPKWIEASNDALAQIDHSHWPAERQNQVLLNAMQHIHDTCGDDDGTDECYRTVAGTYAEHIRVANRQDAP